MSRVRFVPDPSFQAKVQQTKPWKKGMGVITFKLADSIEVAALPHKDTGNYLGRIQPQFDGKQFYVETERFFSHIIDLGSINNAPQLNIRRGTIAAGMRFVDDGPEQG